MHLYPSKKAQFTNFNTFSDIQNKTNIIKHINTSKLLNIEFLKFPGYQYPSVPEDLRR